VSRLVYIVCLLEAVLWAQPNFALSDQRDMARLLQSQTLKLSELAQNAAKDNAVAVFQKQFERIAKEQDMITRNNIRIHNMQKVLLDKSSTKQTPVNQVQRMPQLPIGRGEDGKGELGGVAGTGEKGVEKNGAVPIFSSSQAYVVACCLLVASASALMNESSPVPDDSETNTESDMVAETDRASCPATKRRREDVDDDDDDDEIAAIDIEESKESRRGRKHARLGVQATSLVQQRSQAKNNDCHNKPRFNGNFHSHESEVATNEETILCSPSVSLSSDASSPSESHISSPNPVSTMSGMFSTLPPELVCEFEGEHSLYFHGIVCPSSSSPALNIPSPISSVPVNPFSSVSAPLFDHTSQRVTAIDPALLLVEPRSPELFQQDDDFTPSVSSGQDSEIDESEEVKTSAPAPLFGVSLEPLLHSQCFC